jgi:anti-sigma-K factor RskA
MTSEDRDNLLLYAAGALDPVETSALRSRLSRGTPEEIGALAEAEATLAMLPLALETQAPSNAAKDRLMASLSRARRQSPAPPVRLDLRERRRSSLPTLMALAAAAAIFVVSLVLVVSERRKASDLVASNKQLREELATVRTDIVKTAMTIDQMRAKLAMYDEAVKAEQLRLVGLDRPKPDPASKARGRILWDMERRQWLVVVFDLMPPPEGREYQLWFIPPGEGAKPIPSKPFNTSRTGEAMIAVDIPANVGDIALAAITDEPMGGSKGPTGSMHLMGKTE